MSKKSLYHQNNNISGLSSKITSKRDIRYDIFLYLYLFKILFSGIWPENQPFDLKGHLESQT